MDRPDLDAPASDWLVYADALQVAGDPRGELISLVHGADAAARDTFVHKHAPDLLGPAAKAFRKQAYRLTWRHCFIDKAEILVGGRELGQVAALLAAPAASELRELAIVGNTDGGQPASLTKAIEALATSPLPASCKSLAIVDERAARARTMIARDYNADENLVDFKSLDAVWKLPIEHLRLELADCCYLDFGTIDGRRLKSFTLRALRTLRPDFYGGSNLAQALAASAWDRMEDFELRLAETFVADLSLRRWNGVTARSCEIVVDDSRRAP